MNPPQRALARPRVGPPRQGAMWLWVCVSAGVHAFLVLAAIGARAAGLFAGGGIPTGDGFGGSAVEIEIQGERRDLLSRGSLSAGGQPAVAPSPEQQPEPSEQQDPVQEASTTMTGDVSIHHVPSAEPRHRREEHDRTAQAGAARPEQEEIAGRDLPNRGDAAGSAPSAPGAADTPSGTGADDSTGGAPAGNARDLILGSAGALGSSISAQRALLPNGGRCSDPIAGTWRTQKYRAGDHTWVRFVLHITHEGDALRGTITSRIWSGMPSDPTPSCTAFGFDNTWLMQARGHLDGNNVSFQSTSARLIRQDCPNSDARYAPDNFTGTVDPMREVFQSVNNDGAFDIDEPYSFRRVGCE